ncbi:hypothetical protein PAMA_016311 [Pampus argenteus]
MMGFVHVAAAVLSLLSVGQSAPVTNCESLIQQAEIQGRDQLLGKWIYLADSTNIAGAKIMTQMFVETAWGTFTAANESDAINVFQAQKMFGSCFTLTTKITLKNNTLSMVHPFNVTEVRLHSGCPDCIILLSSYTIGGSTYKGLKLLSRRKKVSDAEMEEFRKQVECLNLPPPTILDTSKGFCLGKQETDVTDLTDIFDNMGPQDLSQLEDLLNNNGLQMLVQLFISIKQLLDSK